MTRTTLGILAGVIASAAGAIWWNRHHSLGRSRVSNLISNDELAHGDVARMAEGIL